MVGAHVVGLRVQPVSCALMRAVAGESCSAMELTRVRDARDDEGAGGVWGADE